MSDVDSYLVITIEITFIKKLKYVCFILNVHGEIRVQWDQKNIAVEGVVII